MDIILYCDSIARRFTKSYKTLLRLKINEERVGISHTLHIIIRLVPPIKNPKSSINTPNG